MLGSNTYKVDPSIVIYNFEASKTTHKVPPNREIAKQSIIRTMMHVIFATQNDK